RHVTVRPCLAQLRELLRGLGELRRGLRELLLRRLLPEVLLLKTLGRVPRIVELLRRVSGRCLVLIWDGAARQSRELRLGRRLVWVALRLGRGLVWIPLRLPLIALPRWHARVLT